MSRGRIVAVLGPTNTGKTHLAIDRMLGHSSGMIGFPLRLLARENYDRVVSLVGRGRVALVTGEEKIIPKNAQYFLCTVESMPLAREVAFLAIDEVQLCADPERGHVFTDRLLRARGREETMFMGAETIAPLLRRMVPESTFETRPRFSRLSYTGARKLSRLPRRSAVVCFAINDVYRVAEQVRRHRGGAAIVLGALSPRTRNAQVELYQSGEVDYLVATDAIGMGLNMDIDHVAFAALRKFDGRSHRPLRPAELAQIAGRAGRHMSDGTFGTTEGVPAIADETVEAIETSKFESVRQIMWRNPDLDFRSGAHLAASLEVKPDDRGLRRGPLADDQRTLNALLADEAVRSRAVGPSATHLLWEVCQIPDFRKTMTDAHTRLAAEIFRQLSGPAGMIGGDWAQGHIAHLDRTDGDIDTLMNRISHVRTWTYISHREGWLPKGRDWQARTRDVEDRLSDALHGALSQRFVDRRSAVLTRSLGDGGSLAAEIDRDGTVSVAGHYVGRLAGFAFDPDKAAHREDSKAILSAARRTLGQEIERRLGMLESDGDSTIALEAGGTFIWRGSAIARLKPGTSVLEPEIMPLANPLLDTSACVRISTRLARWLTLRVDRDLAPLRRLQDHELKGAARGILFQLLESTGCMARKPVSGLIENLSPSDRAAFKALGVALGSRFVYCSGAFTARSRRLLAILVAAARPSEAPGDELPASMPLSWRAEGSASDRFLMAIGYPRVGPLAIRVDMVERMLRQAHAAGKRKALDPAELARTIGCAPDAVPGVLGAIGYRIAEKKDGARTLVPRRQDRPRTAQKRKVAPDSPFASLAHLA